MSISDNAITFGVHPTTLQIIIVKIFIKNIMVYVGVCITLK